MARKNILDITAQKFAAKKLALRRMILRKLATRRLAARKTAALGMVMLLLGGCHVAQLTTLYTDETSVEETASAMMRHTGRLQACIRNMPTICSCKKKSTMSTGKSAVCTKLMTVTGRFCWKRITKRAAARQNRGILS